MSNIVKVITSLFISNISAASYVAMDELSQLQYAIIAAITGIFTVMTLILVFRTLRKK